MTARLAVALDWLLLGIFFVGYAASLPGALLMICCNHLSTMLLEWRMEQDL